MLNFQQTNLAQIGLVLPLSGDGQILGTTIQSGFNDAKGDSTIPVQVFDSSTTPINDIIAQAKASGIKALVGPLLKTKTSMPSLRIQVQYKAWTCSH